MSYRRTSTIQVMQSGTKLNGSENYKLVRITREPNGRFTKAIDIAVFKGPDAQENAKLMDKLLDHFYANAEATNVDKSLFGDPIEYTKPNSHE